MPPPSHARWTTRHTTLGCVAIVAMTAAALLAMGRVPICRCGYVKLWHGVVMSSENSQHLTDWYTFSHVVHGLLFYALLWKLRPGWPLGLRLLASVGIEATWEVAENTDYVINRYREATISLDYYGDSVVNSIADILAMVAGFGIAARAPVAAAVTLVLALELGLAYAIRDNLTLNVIMLIHPLDVVRRWQGGG
jgi:hypothetical protein